MAGCLTTPCRTYASERGGEWPDTLEVLYEIGYMEESCRHLLVNPRQPARKDGYVYIKPLKKYPAFGTVVIHEAYDVWPEGGLVVAFADGDVEIVQSEAEFKRMLSEGRPDPSPDTEPGAM